MSLETLGKHQYEKYVEERSVNRSVPITEKIKLNKLNLMKEAGNQNQKRNRLMIWRTWLEFFHTAILQVKYVE